MIEALHISLCIGVPLLASLVFAVWSRKRLEENPMVTMSPRALKIFLLSRFIFHFAFGILITTFIFAIAHYGMSGEETRLAIATSTSAANVPTLILSTWSNVILPILFASILVALFALGAIGRNALRLMPHDGKPGVEFSGFRFTFLMMAMSLILPPLVFGSLLLL